MFAMSKLLLTKIWLSGSTNLLSSVSHFMSSLLFVNTINNVTMSDYKMNFSEIEDNMLLKSLVDVYFVMIQFAHAFSC